MKEKRQEPRPRKAVPVSLTNTRKDCALVPDRFMITIPIEDCNSFSQKTYNDYVQK